MKDVTYSVTGQGSVSVLVTISTSKRLEDNRSQCRDADDTVRLSLDSKGREIC
jgi:hypothetical protein